MSDFGQSSAIEQSNNLISEGLSNARETREHNRQVMNTYNTKINSINTKTDAVGVSDKTEDTGETGLAGIQTAVATGKEVKTAYQMGVGNYLKSQPGQAKEAFQSAVKTGKNAFGFGAEEGARAANRYIPVGQRVMGGARSAAEAERTGEGMGVVSGVFKKGLGAITSLPDKQVSGLAKGLGAFTGIAGAGLTGIEDLASGSFGTNDKGGAATGVDKSANIASLAAGGLDAMALAMPVLAPVAGVADIVSGALGIAKDVSDKKDTKADALSTKNQDTEQSDSVVSTASSGQIASSSTQSRTY